MMFYNYNPFDRENRPTIIWLNILFVAILYTAFEAPISFVMNHQIQEHHMWWDAFFCSIFFIDVLLRLKNKLKLPTPDKFDDTASDKASTPYYKTIWFPVDLLTSLPFDIIIFALGLHFPTRVLSAIRLVRLLRIVKLRSLFAMADLLPKVMKVTLVVCGITIAIHFIACGWMLITPRPDLDPISYYNVSLYWAVTTLTTVGYGDITPQTNIGRLFTMGVMIIGVASYGVIIGNFSRLILLADRYKEQRKEKMGNLQQFMRYYNIPQSLQRQVFSFYNHLLDKKVTEEDSQIVNDLPQALQHELQIYMKIKLIRNVYIFKDCSIPCLKMIATKLEQSFYVPAEYIIQKGDVGEEMFIIGHGEVEVSIGEKVLTELKAGQFFGEMALLEDTIRTADVKAKAYCDLYRFKKSDFLEVIDRYPDLGQKFKAIYSRRKQDRQDHTKKAA